MIPQPQGQHALVIGGSVAGLLAARVLSEHFAQVTLIDRDTFPTEPGHRAGVPQDHHAHVLLAKGRQIMAHFFPTISQDLRAMGVPEPDLSADGAFLTASGWGQRFVSGNRTNLISRIRLEWYIRNQLQQQANVTLWPQTTASNLLIENGTIKGVQVKRQHEAEAQSIMADLVIDASGRNTHSREWLAAAGYTPPEETVVNAHLGYATRWYQIPQGKKFNWQFLAINTQPNKQNLRAAAVLIVEDNKVVITLVGVNKLYPPTDEAAFRAFAGALATPLVGQVMDVLEPISAIHGYRRTENRWHHYEKLTRHPAGFLVLGDAYCGFNPVYGQGMTTASMAADVLDTLLRQQPARDALPGLFYANLAQKLQTPWLLATGEDLRYSLTEGDRPPLPQRMIQKYTDQIMRIAPYDKKVSLRFVQVLNLLKPPTALLGPDILLRVLWWSAFGRFYDTSANTPTAELTAR